MGAHKLYYNKTYVLLYIFKMQCDLYTFHVIINEKKRQAIQATQNILLLLLLFLSIFFFMFFLYEYLNMFIIIITDNVEKRLSPAKNNIEKYEIKKMKRNKPSIATAQVDMRSGMTQTCSLCTYLFISNYTY